MVPAFSFASVVSVTAFAVTHYACRTRLGRALLS